MSVPGRVISPEAIPVARRLYEETGVPMQVIADTIGINRRTLVRWVKEGAWMPRSRRLPRVAPGPASANTTPEPPPTDEQADRLPRGELIARLVTRIEAEIAAIERLIGLGGGAAVTWDAGPADAERAARTLAVLVRALRELAALEKQVPDGDEDDASRDADAFRRELGATLERVLAGGEAA